MATKKKKKVTFEIGRSDIEQQLNEAIETLENIDVLGSSPRDVEDALAELTESLSSLRDSVNVKLGDDGY
jgi:prefoldin subunit 5